MSKALNSPAARILRSSRFFSLPPPLPQPSVDLPTTSGNIRTSDTATLPYPTKQAISAPASSRHRGDWGLKRPLPERTNNTSTPHVRINAMDTLEHITDFDSASDHTLTLRKAQELNLWMTRANRKRTNNFNSSISAFDDTLDHTALQEPTRPSTNSADASDNINRLPLGMERTLRIRSINSILQQRGEKPERWKTDGPWLPMMSEIDFEKYLVEVVSKPRIRDEFKKFLRKNRADKKRLQAVEQMRDEAGFDPENPDDVARLDEMCRIDQEEDQGLERYILELRSNNTDLSSTLPTLIQEFFDLPPLPKASPSAPHGITGFSTGIRKSSETPPSTHPSGGLSYIRSRSFMENSPVHGPQFQHAPLEARVLRPRRAPQGPVEHSVIGVGGFVTKDYVTGRSYRSGDEDSNPQKGMTWNFDTPGGNKLWVTPSEAHVDDNSRIRIDIVYPEKEAIAVKTGGPDPRKVHFDNDDAIVERLRNTPVLSAADQRNTAPAGTAQNANYGSALPDTRTLPRAQPLEGEELKNLKDAVKQAKGDPNGRLGSSIMNILNSRATTGQS
ncbi:mitochondrial ribosomal protein subunit-domain-containing protein [Elsinoe ampelina]|uniref:Mitochondrial ribosomal protein subunit-domain-containing protein n=1 Tax=Elsinoe ampelina TaxID=302913 RepID=A0A6A6GLD7_9PEZI|nr:mitochondrial ribosomal protein subunit-domain-containing protein [Elsinoe ampelina]